jgi:DNA sulfur modification protein DndD
MQNGGGKTSLFHAIKWGFYGSAFDYTKSKKKMTYANFMNDSADPNEGFYVEIQFKHGDSTYIARRECKFPKSQQDKLTLNKDGHLINESRSSLELDAIVPKNYGNFFMFDGEELEQLANAQNDTRLVEGVLQLLGLKQFKDLKLKLEQVKNEFKKERDEAFKNENQNNRDAIEIEDMRQRIESLDDSISDRKEKINKIDDAIINLNRELEKYSDNSALNIEFNKTKVEITAAERDVKRYEDIIQEKHSHLFATFIKDVIEDNITNIQGKKSELEKLSDMSIDDVEVAVSREKILHQHMITCPICKKSLTEEDRSAIRELVDKEEQRLGRYNENKEKIIKLNNKELYLKSFLKELPDYRLIMGDFYNASSTLEDLIEKRDEMERELGSSGQEDISRLAKTLSDEKGNKVKFQDELGDFLHKKQFVEAQYNERVRKLKGSSIRSSNSRRADENFNRTSTIIDGLDRIINKGIEKKRADILRFANEVFEQITNKSGVYSGLEYANENTYSFLIRKKNGKIAYNPSAGESQVVAMSFLIALTKCTGSASPILMDTPLAKLDQVHSANIGDALASLDNQILFLAQPSELSVSVRESLMRSVAKLYESDVSGNNEAILREVKI